MPRAGLGKIVRYSGEFNLISPPRGMNPVGRPKGRAAPLPFGNPMAKDPAARPRGINFKVTAVKLRSLPVALIQDIARWAGRVVIVKTSELVPFSFMR